MDVMKLVIHNYIWSANPFLTTDIPLSCPLGWSSKETKNVEVINSRRKTLRFTSFANNGMVHLVVMEVSCSAAKQKTTNKHGNTKSTCMTSLCAIGYRLLNSSCNEICRRNFTFKLTWIYLNPQSFFERNSFKEMYNGEFCLVVVS